MSPFWSAFLGSLFAFALLALIARARFRRWRRSGGAPPRFFVRRLARRLGARPEQEQVLLAEADALAIELRALREDQGALRRELGALLAAPALDLSALDAALAARLARLEALRARLRDGLARFHAVLDEGQRRALGQLVEVGPRHAHAHGRHGRC